MSWLWTWLKSAGLWLLVRLTLDLKVQAQVDGEPKVKKLRFWGVRQQDSWGFGFHRIVKAPESEPVKTEEVL